MLIRNLREMNEKSNKLYTLLGVVKCPNNCQQGKTKHYADNKKALYDLVNCRFCKGKGTVSESELKSIEQSI